LKNGERELAAGTGQRALDPGDAEVRSGPKNRCTKAEGLKVA